MLILSELHFIEVTFIILNFYVYVIGQKLCL